MVFAPDAAAALGTVVNLINTAANGGERLGTIEDLDQFLRREGFTGSRTHDYVELASVHALRVRLGMLWRADEATFVEGVNRILRATEAMPQLVKHDHWDWHLHVTAGKEPLKDRIGADAAMALVDVIRSKEMGRLKVCAADNCDAVVLDLSRNRSKRFCENCANRVHIAAYRERRTATA